MDKHYVYEPQGVCAKQISFDIVDDVLHNVVISGGCKGNSKGVAALAEGMPVEDVLRRLRGIPCNGNSSCPDQLAQAVEKCLAEEA